MAASEGLEQKETLELHEGGSRFGADFSVRGIGRCIVTSRARCGPFQRLNNKQGRILNSVWLASGSIASFRLEFRPNDGPV